MTTAEEAAALGTKFGDPTNASKPALTKVTQQTGPRKIYCQITLKRHHQRIDTVHTSLDCRL